MMTNPRIADLVNEYAESVIKQRQAIENGTRKEARYYGSRRTPIAKKLINMGDEAKNQFASLLHHPDRVVRATAGVHLFSSFPEEVLAMFRELSNGDDLVAMGAQLRIKEWEEHPEHYDESNWA